MHPLCKWMPSEYKMEIVTQYYAILFFSCPTLSFLVGKLALDFLTVILLFCKPDFHSIPQFYKNHVYEESIKILIFLFFGDMQAINRQVLSQGRSVGAVHFLSKAPMPPLKGNGKALNHYEPFGNNFLYCIIQSKFQRLLLNKKKNVTMFITLFYITKIDR